MRNHAGKKRLTIKLVIFLVVFILSGCADVKVPTTSYALTHLLSTKTMVSLGTSKDEVIEKWGEPSEIKKIDYILKPKDVPEELFSQVEAIVKKNGLLLKSLKIESGGEESKDSSQKVSRTTEEKTEVALPPEIGKTKATLEVLGVDYFGLKSLLASMENNLMLMDVASVNFAPEGNSVQLVFYTYYLKE